MFAPKKIYGIDIDGKLISQSKNNLALQYSTMNPSHFKVKSTLDSSKGKQVEKEIETEKPNESEKQIEKTDEKTTQLDEDEDEDEITEDENEWHHFPISFPIQYGYVPFMNDPVQPKHHFPYNVEFYVQDFVTDEIEEVPTYDVVLW